MRTNRKGVEGRKKKREARALWLLGGECVKNGNDSKWVSSSLPVPSLAKACADTGCVRARAQIEILKRTFTARGATPLTNWSGALLIRCHTWASSCDWRGPHVSAVTARRRRRLSSLQLQTLLLGTRQAADDPARSDPMVPFVFWPVKYVYTADVILHHLPGLQLVGRRESVWITCMCLPACWPNIAHKSWRQLWEVSDTLACHTCTHLFSSVRQFLGWTHLSCTAAADRCLKSRFGSQRTDVTDDFFFFLSLFVISFLLSFFSHSACRLWVFTACGLENKKHQASKWGSNAGFFMTTLSDWSVFPLSLTYKGGAAWISVITSPSQ